MAGKKQLDFRATAPVPSLDDDESGASRDIWLATWGVVAVFVIVVLVLFFTGNLGVTGAGVALVPEQKACTQGNAVTDMERANDMIAMGAQCQAGLTPYTKCCWWPQ